MNKYQLILLFQEVDTNGEEEDPLSPESRHLVSLLQTSAIFFVFLKCSKLSRFIFINYKVTEVILLNMVKFYPFPFYPYTLYLYSLIL